MVKQSFKEYCQAKEYLRAAADSIPRIAESYSLTKYCKLPIVVDEVDGEKGYVAFKPKDRIEVVFEYLNPDAPAVAVVSVTTEDEQGVKVQPAWGDVKLISWLKNSTRKME
jgi:hypothetical protein